MGSRMGWRAVVCGLSLQAAVLATAWAQAPAGVQVTGEEIRSWLAADQMAVAGINLMNGCHFIAKGTGTARMQTIFCPSAAQPFTVTGEVAVDGNRLCSKFSYPDGSRTDVCQDIFRVGDNKYEARVGGMARIVLYRLIR